MAATDLIREDVAQALALAMATDVKALAVMLNNNAGNNNALTTVNKASLVAAINELDAAIDALSGGGSASQLDDLTDVAITGPATGHLLRYNGTAFVNVLGSDYFVTPAALTSALDALVAAAPGALDTLNELAAALGDDPDFAATITAALGSKQATTTFLTNWLGTTRANNKIGYFTGTDTVGVTDFTATGRAVVGAADAAAARTAIGVVYSSADLAAYYTAARA